MSKYKAQNYTYRVFPNDEGGFISTVAEFKSLSNVGSTMQEAIEGMVALLQVILDDMEKAGEVPPEPLQAREYTGKFALRMTPEQHRRLAIESAEMGVSMNQLLVSRV